MKLSSFLGYLGFLCSAAMYSAHAQTLTTEQWREDLWFVSATIDSSHPNPFHAVSEAAFQNRVDALHEKIPTLEDHEIVVEMFGIVAMLRDAHTQLQGGLQFLSGRYPLHLQVFDDGIFVRSAPAKLKRAIGARLLRLGDTTAAEAYRRIAAITPHDNDMTLKNWTPRFMIIPEVLHALEITPKRDRAQFILVDRERRKLILELKPLPFAEPIDWIDSPEGDFRPLYLRHLNVNYWHEILEDTKTLYVQYNRVRNAPDESIEHYFARLTSLLAESPIESIVLDVRFNSGGNGYLNAPVVAWVKSALPSVSQHFYVIIGRGTFSAGQKLVTVLDASTDVTLVGESTGSSPNHFGDALKFPLHHSDLTLAVSSIYHADAPGDVRLATEPDLPVTTTSVDLFSGRDPALEAILSTLSRARARTFQIEEEFGPADSAL